MLVSAISMCDNIGCFTKEAKPHRYNKQKDIVADTSFNSLAPYTVKKSAENERMQRVYDSINEWQTFCHNKILGKKLDIIA